MSRTLSERQRRTYSSVDGRLFTGDVWEQDHEDRVLIARRALNEAGRVDLSHLVKSNRAGHPTLRHVDMTADERLLVQRAFRLGHMADPDGRPVRCCLTLCEVEHEALMADGGYMRACDRCPGEGPAS